MIRSISLANHWLRFCDAIGMCFLFVLLPPTDLYKGARAARKEVNARDRELFSPLLILFFFASLLPPFRRSPSDESVRRFLLFSFSLQRPIASSHPFISGALRWEKICLQPVPRKREKNCKLIIASHLPRSPGPGFGPFGRVSWRCRSKKYGTGSWCYRRSKVALLLAKSFSVFSHLLQLQHFRGKGKKRKKCFFFCCSAARKQGA